MVISFYLDNENHQGVDYSNPELGNPGVGGTQYMFWAIAYYLKKFYNDIQVNILAPYVESMPESINSYKVINIIDSIKVAKEIGSDILVLRGPCNNEELFSLINLYKINIVFWSHNFENWKFVELASKCEYVKRNICVGKEQLDRLRDHEIFMKSMYIHNALDFKIYDPYSKLDKKDKIVGYMGSLTEKKGFHRLAKLWKYIVDQVPEAKLYVIGGGDLYGKKWQLGERNLTNPKYENKLMKYLTTESGEILPSVEFMGVVSGTKKLEILNKLKVGVANPTGIGETFCIVATEYEALGIPVVTIKKNGFLDTIKDKKSGLLFKNDKEFIEYIIKLLNNDNLNYELGEYGKKMVREKFNIEFICSNWYTMLYNVLNNVDNKVDFEAENWFNDYKWIREINRNIRNIPGLRWVPSILWYKEKIRTIYMRIKK